MGTRGRLAKLATVAAVVAAPIVGLTTPAGAASVECGASVTGPISLTHDLHCSGDAITLLGGQLNLHGHTISGDGTGIGISIGGAGATSAQVINGTVANFAVGVVGTGSGTVSLSMNNVALTRNGTALDATSMHASLFHVRLMHNSGDAVMVSSPGTVSIRHSSIIGNGRGVDLIADGRADIDHTPISGNRSGIACSQGLVRVSQSTVSASATGIELFQCEGSQFTAVRFVDNTKAGIDVLFATSDVADPTLRIYRATFAGNGVGLHLSTDVTAVQVVNSTFSRNGIGVLADSCSDVCPITPEDSFAGNRFIRNNGDGLRWGFGTVQVYANTFLRNGGWGFFAADGTTVIDNGSNVARNNGAGDCYRLACS